ncbi:attractin-like protein 1 isoform X2 [Culicoides brevitarsis]|uniref:attractin-like protein 1 isoform X2 n=1 Tax=Culicoides brevitarsis TaxID=469753 RepID=UPI00307CB42E
MLKEIFKKTKYRRKCNFLIPICVVINYLICINGDKTEIPQGCSGKIRLSGPSGFIHDGLGNYSVGVKCSWLIDARNHTSYGTISQRYRYPDDPVSIRLHFEEFATECSWDHLYVFDGDSVESPLLGVFSGIMYQHNFSLRRIPEVVALSGAALLHFFSDDAYNMSGFNISYKINGCPTSTSALNCSGHGYCSDGECMCDDGYEGIGCHIPICPNNCSAELRQGHCHGTKCSCAEGFAGADCSQDKSRGYWETIAYGDRSLEGSASHGATVWKDSMYIIAGESYSKGELLYMYDLNGNVWETVHSENVPEQRYGASTVIYGDKIYMYGGVVDTKNNRKEVSSELWALDVNARVWENITVKVEQCNATNAMCAPLKSSGHSATLIPGFEGNRRKNPQYMLVIFGHSPEFGYLNTVQEYNFATREWKILQTRGFPVKGGYGHSASYDELTERIYVYGGIVSENESTQMLSTKLFSYDPLTRTWTMLTPAPSGRFLHTGNFISPGLMMVFGGNTHNDTLHSFGAKCYSNDWMIYDVICDSWNVQQIPADLSGDLSRFGHSAVLFEKSLYIYGGFDGQMLSDMLKYTPGTCKIMSGPGGAESCVKTYPGLKCIYDIQKSECIAVGDAQKDLLFSRDQESYTVCRTEGRTEATKQHIANNRQCEELQTCQSCVSTSFNCGFCGVTPSKSVCTIDKCPDVSYKHKASPFPIRSLDQCHSDSEPVCTQLHACQACHAFPHCHWDYQNGKCRHFENSSGVPDADLPGCPSVCSSFNTCGNCTNEECIWCQNEERCVDKNAYIASFPYGQCREWTTLSTKCRSPSNGTSQCEFYKSCGQCRDDPACGWCDDGSNTGIGKCLPGGDSGPTEEFHCPHTQRWHFTQCPNCQCNGHSECGDDEKTCLQPCRDLTHGPNCEKCKSGYWGNPVNGGKCQKCECNNQATHCNGETGKCFCSTKGLAGDHCEKCDVTNHYHGDPSKGSCYYDLTIDYQFTFNLSKKEDRYFTQINFRNSPIKADVDADFSITCSVAAKMNITIRTGSEPQEKTLFSGVNCSTFRYRFSKAEYTFGIEDNMTLTTFYVYVYDFHPPLWIQIAFSQYPKLNLQQFFITFSTCFLALLLMAAILWKIKQRYDMFRRRQRLYVEMEQMASRPFSQVLVDIENKELLDTTPEVETITNVLKKRKKDSPSPIALEPCEGNKAAVLSLLVRLPTGGKSHSPLGQAAGIAVASALVTLGNRRPSLDSHPEKQQQPNSKQSNTKRSTKQSQHPADSCT